jgi:hypothetical protein
LSTGLRAQGQHGRFGERCVATAPCDIRTGMSFEIALKEGRLEEARAVLADLKRAPDTGGLWLPECYADLAKAFDRQGQHDDAIDAMERAIEHGWSGRPDPRSDIAEFHLRSGRRGEAARIWAELKIEDPDDVWLYNAAGLSYSEVGDHELASSGSLTGSRVRGSWQGPGGGAGRLRSRALSAGGWDRLASGPERSVLVRLWLQVQEVLWPG